MGVPGTKLCTATEFMSEQWLIGMLILTLGAPVKGGGKEKDRITLMLGAMADGKKLKPLLIFN